MSEKNNIVWEKYLQYFSEICAGARPMPAGLSAQSEDEMAKVVELQTQVLDMGIPEFVRRCAEAAGETIPQEALDAFDLQAVLAELEAEAPQEAPVKDRGAQHLRGFFRQRLPGGEPSGLPH